MFCSLIKSKSGHPWWSNSAWYVRWGWEFWLLKSNVIEAHCYGADREAINSPANMHIARQ